MRTKKQPFTWIYLYDRNKNAPLKLYLTKTNDDRFRGLIRIYVAWVYKYNIYPI